MDIGQRQKGEQHGSNKINSRSCDVIKTDVHDTTRDEELHSTVGEVPCTASYAEAPSFMENGAQLGDAQINFNTG